MRNQTQTNSIPTTKNKYKIAKVLLKYENWLHDLENEINLSTDDGYKVISPIMEVNGYGCVMMENKKDSIQEGIDQIINLMPQFQKVYEEFMEAMAPKPNYNPDAEIKYPESNS